MTDHGTRPAAGQTPAFEEGARVTWTRRDGKTYPATVEGVGWYRRTAEPWNYMIRLDRTPATSRMTHLLRFPPQSQLSAECQMDTCTHPAAPRPVMDANPDEAARKQIGQTAICECCQAGIDRINQLGRAAGARLVWMAKR